MKRFGTGRSIALVALIAVVMSMGMSQSAVAQTEVQHGIAFTKGCTSPVAVGSPYRCSFSVLNFVDAAQDTLTFNSIVDTVHAASGDQTTGNIISTVKLDRGVTSATCTGGGGFSGSGTVADPWIGATLCRLPFGSLIHVQSSSHYTVQAGDFALANHTLTDDASLGWNDVCDDPAHSGNSNCNPNPQPTGAGSSAVISQPGSNTTTAIHNASHVTVTSVPAGTAVHDFVTVAAAPGLPIPTGNVSIDWFTNGLCSGAPAANSGPVGPLDASGSFDAVGFSFTPGPGQFGFAAHYLGDKLYRPSDGLCEPLTVNAITPALCATTIRSNFNGTRIPDGSTIWFNSVLKVSGLHTPATIQLTNSQIQFSAAGVNYTITVPNAIISFSSVSKATISFDGTNWQTTVPLAFGGNVFLSGVAFTVPPGGLPGGINPVTWSGVFLSSTPGVSLNWQWSAAVYSTFNADYNALGVKPLHSTSLDAYPNGDQAGTPENLKPFVIGGARGGGGSNFTGSYSPTGHCP